MAHTAIDRTSAAQQMYLKTIFDIQSEKGAARVTDIAARLGVKKGSVSVALKNLSEKGLVNYAPYDVTTLTDAGVEIAKELANRYEVLVDFFVDVLGINAAKADVEACELEHHISPELYERLVGFVDYYQSCATSRFRWKPDVGGFCADPDDVE